MVVREAESLSHNNRFWKTGFSNYQVRDKYHNAEMRGGILITFGRQYSGCAEAVSRRRITSCKGCRRSTKSAATSTLTQGAGTEPAVPDARWKSVEIRLRGRQKPGANDRLRR